MIKETKRIRKQEEYDAKLKAVFTADQYEKIKSPKESYLSSYFIGICFFSACTYLSFSAFLYRYDLRFDKFSQSYTEPIVIRYSNDLVYCEGTYQVSVALNRSFYAFPRCYKMDTTRRMVGHWIFYHPYGNTDTELWFDSNYKLIRKNPTNQFSGKVYRQKSTKKGETVFKVFEDEKLIAEIKKEDYSISKDGNDHETITEYYPNGMEESIRVYTPLYNEWELTKWDTTGLIILKVEKRYKDDEIINVSKD